MPPRVRALALSGWIGLAVLATACAARGGPTPPAAAPPATVSQGAGASASGPLAQAAAPVAVTERPPTKLVMGLTGPSLQSWPMYVALARGLYLQEGLDLEHVVLSASTTQTQALIAGDLHLNTYSVDSMAKGVLGGAPLKLIGAAQHIPNFQLIVSPEIASFADLRGKTVAAGSPGGYFDIVLRGMLSVRGLDAADYQILSVSNPRARVPAIKAGQIGGAIVGGPDDLAALADGLTSLGYLHETIPDIDYSGFAIAEQWGRANEALVVAFLRATLQGIDWLRHPANKEQAKRIYGQVTELQPEFLERLYDQMIVQQMLSLTMRPNLKGIENVLALGLQQGSLTAMPPVERWVDLSYLDKASAGSR